MRVRGFAGLASGSGFRAGSVVQLGFRVSCRIQFRVEGLSMLTAASCRLSTWSLPSCTSTLLFLEVPRI